MSRKREDLSQEQADMLLEQHKQELEFLSRSMEVEKQRQLASLGDKIAERKKRKAAALQQRHKAEMAKETMNQQDQRQKVEDDKVNIYNLVQAYHSPRRSASKLKEKVIETFTLYLSYHADVGLFLAQRSTMRNVCVEGLIIFFFHPPLDPSTPLPPPHKKITRQGWQKYSLICLF